MIKRIKFLVVLILLTSIRLFSAGRAIDTHLKKALEASLLSAALDDSIRSALANATSAPAKSVPAKRSADQDVKAAIAASIASATREDKERKEIQAAIAASIGESKKKSEEKKKLEDDRFHTFRVLPQRGLDCLFHAIKNGFWIYKYKLLEIDEKTCREYINTKEPRVFPLEVWRDEVIQIYKMKTNLDTLPGLYIAKNLLKLKDKDFTFIPNLFQCNSEFIDPIHSSLIKTIKEFRSSAKKTHIFYLGDMELIKDPATGQDKSKDGHWITIVVHKENGKIFYYGADSLTYVSPATAKLPRFFKKLSDLIEKAAIIS